MENTADEIKRLQDCINNLTSVRALPALWSGQDSSQIVRTLLDAVVVMLRLDFAYARLSVVIDGPPIEVVRLAQRQNPAVEPHEVGRALDRWLTDDALASPLVVPNPSGEGEVTVASFRLGLGDEIGVLVAGSERADFPTQVEMLLLRVATNQAAIWLQEARRLSEQRRVEAKLRESEERFRSYFELGLIGMAITSPTRGCIEVNDQICEILGYERSELLQKTWAEMTHPDDLAADVANFNRVMAGEIDGYSMDKRWIRKDGRVINSTISVKCLRRADGSVDYFVALLQDITERKRAEKALHRAHEELERRVVERTKQLVDINEELKNEISERRRAEEKRRDLASLVENSTDFIGITTLEGKVLFINPAGQQMVGLGGSGQVRATEIADYLTEQDWETYRQQILPAIMREGRWEEEMQFRHLKTGALIPMWHHVFSIKEQGSDRPVALATVSRNITERKRAEEALRKAFDEIKALKDQLAQEKHYLEEEIRTEGGFKEIIGESAAIKRVLKQVEIVAPTDSTVLIQGETGTGKELIARAVHNLSRRRERTFVKINCAAIPTGLLESELFGHEKGAFTGAIAQRVGRFELASGGTLFLDEVGDIPLDLQSKLLRVLQEQEFERLGSNRTISVDVRLVTATNLDLAQMVERREFRSDFYYRLRVFPIVVPPLRERAEDIPLLIQFFIRKHSSRLGKSIVNIPTKTMNALCRYVWRGNVRELGNFIERCVILSPGQTLEAPLTELRQNPSTGEPKHVTTLEDAEREHILQALKECGWVIAGPSGAAAKLGVKRTSLQYRMQKLGIIRPSPPPPPIVQ